MVMPRVIIITAKHNIFKACTNPRSPTSAHCPNIMHNADWELTNNEIVMLNSARVTNIGLGLGKPLMDTVNYNCFKLVMFQISHG